MNASVDSLDAAAVELILSGLAVLRHIPDGQIRSGCVIDDGKQVRERFRKAVITVRDLSKKEPS